jgi:hypothetical protein
MSQTITQNSSLAALDQSQTLISDKSGNIWSNSGSSADPTNLALPQNLASGAKLLTDYQGNLYIYSDKNQAIYRVSNFQKEIGSPAVYLKLASLGINGIKSWAINGDIIIIDNDNRVFDLKNKKKTSLDLTLDASDNLHIAASTQANGWLISSDHIISSYDSQGQINKKILVLADQPITSLATDSQGKSLYLSAGKQLSQINL